MKAVVVVGLVHAWFVVCLEKMTCENCCRSTDRLKESSMN